MIRHWWQGTFLLFALFALVACSGASPDVESTLVEVPSTTLILPTSSPPPSATPFPTETASLTPTPQPSLTATSEPTQTSTPTEAIPTPPPEFGMRRKNPDTNQQEYWDGAQWRLPERFEPEPGTFIDVFPTGETVIITPEDQIASALETYNAFSIPGLGAINESATTQLETESISIFTHDQGSYTDASLLLKNILLPVAASRENWTLNFDNTEMEIPAIRLIVAYKHADGRVLNGTLVFSYMVQDGYGNLTDNFDSLLRQLQNKPKSFGIFIVTDKVEGRRNGIPAFWQHYFPYDESTINKVLTLVDSGNFIFGDPAEGNSEPPTLVDMIN